MRKIFLFFLLEILFQIILTSVETIEDGQFITFDTSPQFLEKEYQVKFNNEMEEIILFQMMGDIWVKLEIYDENSSLIKTFDKFYTFQVYDCFSSVGKKTYNLKFKWNERTKDQTINFIIYRQKTILTLPRDTTKSFLFNPDLITKSLLIKVSNEDRMTCYFKSYRSGFLAQFELLDDKNNTLFNTTYKVN
jgi:hypothetical protein